MKRTIENALHVTKAVAALVSAIATSLLAIYGPDTKVGHVLIVVVAVAGVLAVYRLPNLDPEAEHQDESVQPPHVGLS